MKQNSKAVLLLPCSWLNKTTMRTYISVIIQYYIILSPSIAMVLHLPLGIIRKVNVKLLSLPWPWFSSVYLILKSIVGKNPLPCDMGQV